MRVSAALVDAAARVATVVVDACEGHGGGLFGVRNPGMLLVDWVLLVVAVACAWYGHGFFHRGVAVGVFGAIVVGGCGPVHLVGALVVVAAVAAAVHGALRVPMGDGRLRTGKLALAKQKQAPAKTLKAHPLSRPRR